MTTRINNAELQSGSGYIFYQLLSGVISSDEITLCYTKSKIVF